MPKRPTTKTGLSRRVGELEKHLEAAQATLLDAERRAREYKSHMQDLQEQVKSAHVEAANLRAQLNTLRRNRDKLIGYVEGHRAFTSPNVPNRDDSGHYIDTWLDIFLRDCMQDGPHHDDFVNHEAMRGPRGFRG